MKLRGLFEHLSPMAADALLLAPLDDLALSEELLQAVQTPPAAAQRHVRVGHALSSVPSVAAYAVDGNPPIRSHARRTLTTESLAA